MSHTPAPTSQPAQTAGRFGGKLALVTGASRGIGFATAQRLIDDGATVIITARKEEALREATESLGPNAHWVAGSVGDEDHHGEIEALLEQLGPLDLLVNNVGINPVFGPMMDIDPKAAHKIITTNVLGSFELTRLAVRKGLRDQRGAIVNISSIAGVASATGIGMYGVSKTAVLGMTRQLAAELAPDIRVNAVAPAAVKTNFARALYEGREQELSAKYPMARLGVPEDVAGPVTFLLSDDAAWITGQCIVIDGGATLITAE
ncbi:MAG TPA: SDR family oxidoreductase [Enteractinococcus sp.]